MIKTAAVSDSGPIIHLSEVDAGSAFGVFGSILIPPEVSEEVGKFKTALSNLRIVRLAGSAKDLAGVISAKYNVELGEAAAIALAVQEKIRLILTDDLAARDVATAYDLEPHGSLGVLLRAFRDGLLTQEAAVGKVRALYSNSSLFVTKDLVLWIVKQMESYKV